ncbi:MAG: plasmid-related protein [Alcanivorax sp.]|jgi:ribosomal protein S12|uniref:DNA-binding protein n=1 Tax=Alcanivorax TaxID=59753 RepID=UPI000C696EE8|nr:MULTISPECIES: DNA-binding protein [Alcanivorax]MAC13310.1 plasmid-related protein [Alcanivorax sp.]MBG32341.1 plasmid-related protein [Alcanivorax sp.]MDF1636382.1 DNA-binding protein [Alcanivorax jadensis]|tara:strand:+ start:406 stop:618 length:213 start_codon:yes stop_codon:yes gene_type:complete
MTTEEQLLKRYGPLLSLTDLSDLLKRSPDGLRISLRSQSEFANKWNSAKRKVGRRVYFKASDVAELIDES